MRRWSIPTAARRWSSRTADGTIPVERERGLLDWRWLGPAWRKRHRPR